MNRPKATLLALGTGVVLLTPTAALASCVETTPRQDWRRADVVFVGTSRESGETGFTDFDVEAYLKGSGPQVAHVLTGQRQVGVAGSNDLDIPNGKRWVIYAYETPRWLRSDFCTGSHSIKAGAPVPSGQQLGAPETSIDGTGTTGHGGGATGPPLGLIGFFLILAVPLIALVVVALRTRQTR